MEVEEAWSQGQLFSTLMQKRCKMCKLMHENSRANGLLFVQLNGKKYILSRIYSSVKTGWMLWLREVRCVVARKTVEMKLEARLTKTMICYDDKSESKPL